MLLNYKEGFLRAIALKGSKNKTYNIILHIFGYFKNDLPKDEKELILSSFEEFKNGVIPLIAVIKILNLLVLRFDDKYLKAQKFLNPYPKELGLRSSVQSLK